MALRKLMIISALTVFLFPAFVMAGDDTLDAKQRFAQGEALLKKGEIQSAFEAFAAASKADPRNEEYTRQAMLIRRVLTLRKSLDGMEFSPSWEKTMLSLHAFYMTHNIYGQALVLDKLAHEKMDNAMSASLLAETLLALGKNGEALELLENLDTEKLNQQNRLYLGITLARLNRLEEAGKIRDEYLTSESTDIGFLFDMARMNTLLGDAKNAYRLLTICFENTPPSQLAQIKTFVIECRDFNPLMDSAGFAAVMETASKVVESGCSGGASCGSCPSRNQCSSQSEAKANQAGCKDCKEDANCDECKKK
ncbi:MAG: hypothetical protein ABIK28_07105 [Planctomycetota bacterium]